MAEVHQYDFGSILKAQVVDSDGNVQPVSDATSIQFFLAKPNGAVLTKTGQLSTDGSDGYIQYTVQSGDLDTVGLWQIQGYITSASGAFRTSISQFRVDENIA